jgi:hypothetical protein
MRVDRTTFLGAALAMYACHAAQRHEPVATDPAPEPIADTPAPMETTEPVSEPPDAGSVSTVDAGAAVDANPIVDAGPPPSLAALQKSCRTLPVDKSCGNDTRRKLCQLVLAEFDRPAAARAIECYGAIESTCDPCSIRSCTQNALVGHPKQTLRECETVRKKASELSDEAYGEVMYELCEEYASPMTPVGRKRFVKCLRDNVGIGVRYCLWDPSATPCTESGEPRRPVVPEL